MSLTVVSPSRKSSRIRIRVASAKSRRLSLYRKCHKTTRQMTSVGYCSRLKGVPVRSLNPCSQARQQKRQYPNSVRSGRSVVAVDAQCGHILGLSSFQRSECTRCTREKEGGVKTDRTCWGAPGREAELERSE